MENILKKVQISLNERGFNCGNADGIMGTKTETAIIAFKKSIGYKARAYLGPLTIKALGISQNAQNNFGIVPWLNEMSKWFGIHEEDPKLEAYLASDNVADIDPDNIPWCAAIMHQVLHDSMPNEKMPIRVKQNPLLAYNYLTLGNELKHALFGTIVVLWRGHKESIKGHIAIVIGYDPIRKRYRIRGGNQSDMVCDTWIDAHRVRKGGFRVPSTYKGTLPPLPIMNSTGAVISTNEA